MQIKKAAKPAVLIVLLLVLMQAPVFAAADFSDITQSFNSEMSSFGDTLGIFVSGFRAVARIIAISMMAIAGVMVAFNVQDGRKAFWNWMLGIGLALNILDILWGIFGPVVGSNAAFVSSSFSQDLELAFDSGSDVNGESFNFVEKFVNYYVTMLRIGAHNIVPYAARILIILTILQATMEVALKLVEGDKLGYILKLVMKTGIYLFLIVNWLAAPGNPTGQLDLMHRLASGFEALGYTAAGDPDSGWHVNSIFANGITFWESYHTHIGDGSLVTKIVGVIGALVGVLFIFLIGLQMLVAKLEFYTMAMLTLPLLGFAPLPQTKFLFEKAIGAMFNLAIKVMCIGFFNVLIARVLSEFTENVKTASAKTGFVGDISLLLQFLLLVIFLWLLVSKVPALVQGLLSGNPSLGGADLISSAKTVKSAGSKAMHGAGSAAGTAASVGAGLAKGYSDGASGKGGWKAGLAGAAGVGVAGAGMAMSALNSAVANSSLMKGFNSATEKLLGGNSSAQGSGGGNGGGGTGGGGNSRGLFAGISGNLQDTRQFEPTGDVERNPDGSPKLDKNGMMKPAMKPVKGSGHSALGNFLRQGSQAYNGSDGLSPMERLRQAVSGPQAQPGDSGTPDGGGTGKGGSGSSDEGKQNNSKKESSSGDISNKLESTATGAAVDTGVTSATGNPLLGTTAGFAAEKAMESSQERKQGEGSKTSSTETSASAQPSPSAQKAQDMAPSWSPDSNHQGIILPKGYESSSASSPKTHQETTVNTEESVSNLERDTYKS